MTSATDTTSRRETPSALTDGGDATSRNGITLVSTFGGLWTLGALILLAGLEGAVLGGVVILAWLWESEWVAFAVGHVGALALLPPASGPLEIAPLEVGLVVLLFGSLVGTASPYRTLGVSLATLGVIGGLAVGASALTGSLLAAAVVLVAGGASVAYLAHRYERLRLGLLGGEPA